jgi:hypothetical protein
MKEDKTKHEYFELVEVRVQTKNKGIQAFVRHVFIDLTYFLFLECNNQEASQDYNVEVW